jgi:hypothetical protein
LKWDKNKGTKGYLRLVVDAPAATSEAPTMGMSFFSIAGGFLRGFFVEKMMGQERRLQ